MKRNNTACIRLFVFALMLSAMTWQSAAAVSCTLTVSQLGFSRYNFQTKVAVNTTGTVTIQCDSTVPPLSLTLSTGGSGTYNRTMTSNGHTLKYNVYIDYARTMIWGNGSGGTSLLSYSQTGTTKSTTIAFYGTVLAGQTPFAGTYTDNPLVTVVY